MIKFGVILVVMLLGAMCAEMIMHYKKNRG